MLVRYLIQIQSASQHTFKKLIVNKLQIMTMTSTIRAEISQ
jgi:hypothetical protein